MSLPRILFVLATILTLCSMRSGAGETAPPLATYTFGLGLNTGMNNELFTLFIIKEFEGKVIETAPLTRALFVQQAQGIVPSQANSEQINLFRKYNVEFCYIPEDTAVTLLDCPVFDELWKLRFWEYPFRPMEGQHPGKGWAEKPDAPSGRQLLLLTDYGIMHSTGVAIGNDNVFRLLHDIGDPEWVDNYRKGY
ncbi:MAG: hypothetical protein KBF87_05905 [Flavobacteriales bacterium]|nr:hypothetical protein [Flavobacteriales bacterium]MBP9138002.1 hypothetical protein [Flavobacteriales bacterium]HQV52527.1 hypothetical protein [Flavobacteriales bacterium]HQX29515.1 hypothetical protein [Flavobacteriales bacterium]HQX39077.1 hypothetical protein [Flavobacteriales bacterium]